MRNLVLTLTAAALTPFAAASAQQVEVAAPRNVISIQPINAVLTMYSAEYERQASAAGTFGFGGTYLNVGSSGIDEVTYKSADVKLRYYPNGRALMGFSFGATGGFTSLSGTDFNGNNASVSGPSLGVLLEYQWLLGEKRNFSVALGAGAKALFVKADQFTGNNNFITRYPTARVSVGYAF
jgi:hypothetical protein